MRLASPQELSEKIGPAFEDIPLDDELAVRISRVGLTRKIEIFQMIVSQLGENAEFDMQDPSVISLLTSVITKTIVDEDGEYAFDTPEGHEILMVYAGSPPWHEMFRAVIRLNKLNLDVREEELEAAKNG